MPNMRGFAFLGCRLLSLAALYWVLQTIELSVLTVQQFIGSGYALGSETAFHLVFWPVFFSGLDLAIVLVLWFGADWISARMTRDAPAATEDQDWSRSAVLSMAVAVIGLLLLVSLVPRAAQNFYLIFFEGHVNAATLIPVLVHVVLTLAIGLGCLLGRRGIAAFIVKARGR